MLKVSYLLKLLWDFILTNDPPIENILYTRFLHIIVTILSNEETTDAIILEI